MLSRVLAGLVVGTACVASAPGFAADFSLANETLVVTEAVPPSQGWGFQVTPYAWLTGVSGNITARGRSVSTSANFLELLKNSDELIPFMGYIEARKDRFSIFGDVFYSKIGFSASDTKQTNPVAGLEVNTDRKGALDTTLAVAQLAAAYDVIKANGTTLGFYAGARYWYTDAELTLKITKSVDLKNLGLKRKGQYAIAHTAGTDWVDPIVGMRLRQELTPVDQLTLAADIGGFGLGSELTWQLFAGYNHTWQISRQTQMALALGYRVLSVDYESGSGTSKKELDLLLHGPLAGLTFRW